MRGGLRPVRLGGVIWLLVVGLLLGGLAGCADDAPPRREEDEVAGKTPVVRPEDVHARGAGGSAVLAPDYRRELQPAAEVADASGSGQRPAGKPGRVPADQPAAPPQAQAPTQAPASAPAPTAPAAPVPGPDAAAPGRQKNDTAAPSAGFPVADCRQLVLVVAPDFEAKRAVLRRFVREAATAPWREVGERAEAILGRAGLGLGRGLGPDFAGPVKQAGDGRTPAGLFPLPEAFGQASTETARAAGVRLPYQTAGDRTACVTDPASPLFGRIAGPEARSQAGAPGRQERMRRADGANVWGVVIGHNLDHPDPAAGSCLFVNVRPAGGPQTGGSIGLPEPEAAALVAWLDPAARPLLAVLPEREYQAVRARWGLP